MYTSIIWYEAIVDVLYITARTGQVDRRPCLISPYHYRLDWLMWFAAFQVCLDTLFVHTHLFISKLNKSYYLYVKTVLCINSNHKKKVLFPELSSHQKEPNHCKLLMLNGFQSKKILTFSYFKNSLNRYLVEFWVKIIVFEVRFWG